jgi:hypothetical protein
MDKLIYEECWNESVFSFWQKRIISVKETQLRELVLQLPSHWVSEDEAERIISRLLLDQEIIRELEFGSFDPRSAPWKHPRGLSNSLKRAVTRSFARMAGVLEPQIGEDPTTDVTPEAGESQIHALQN